jgi:hypothetical protein
VSSITAVTETDRAQEGAQAMLTPLGARLLVGFPLAEIGDRLKTRTISSAPWRARPSVA